MTKLTLLQMTQDILSNLSSDEVNSISDTVESMQVATIIKQKYYDIVARGDLPEHNQLFQLNPSLTNLEPVLMFVPDGVGRIEYIKYFNTSVLASSTLFDNDFAEAGFSLTATDDSGSTSGPAYEYVTMLPTRQFIEMVNNFDVSQNNVHNFTLSDTSNKFPGNFSFNFRNDKQPQFCCILSNFYVIFDSYDATQDSTLQGSKTMCYGQVVPTFQMVDSFIPDLDSQQFPLLLNEAKALAFYELKQQPHAMANMEIKRQWSTVQKNKSINNKPGYFEQLPDFGRKAPYTSRPHIRWS